HSTGARDVRLPEDFPGRIDFDDAALAGVGHQETITRQVLDADPEALRQRHLADGLAVDVDLDNLGILGVDNVAVTVLANRVRPGDVVLPDPLAVAAELHDAVVRRDEGMSIGQTLAAFGAG